MKLNHVLMIGVLCSTSGCKTASNTDSASSVESAATGPTHKVKCTLTDSGNTEWVQLTLDANDKIVQQTKKKWATSSGGKWLDVFSQDVENYGFEWQKSFKAPNGYNILELGTTADSFQIGVNMGAGKGFFTYHDLGSGAGNKGPLTLACTKS